GLKLLHRPLRINLVWFLHVATLLFFAKKFPRGYHASGKRESLPSTDFYELPGNSFFDTIGASNASYAPVPLWSAYNPPSRSILSLSGALRIGLPAARIRALGCKCPPEQSATMSTMERLYVLYASGDNDAQNNAMDSTRRSSDTDPLSSVGPV